MNKIILFILLGFPFTAAAQQLKGTVTDKNGHKLDAVTISISQQSLAVASVLSDSGHFVLPALKAGNYILSATLIGYQSIIRAVALPKDSLQLIMQPDSKLLKEVTVSGSRPVIVRKIDRITFNVENSIIASGGTAWDALTKAPGVKASANNELSTNHKYTEIYLDGKALHLSGDDLSNYLKGLSADVIAQIEVFSNPPAQFEAQGNSVINIITKKAKRMGLNVSLNASATKAAYGSYMAGTNFNYRKNNLNIYGTYGFNARSNTMDHNVLIDFGSSKWDSPNHNIYNSYSHNYRLGADYQLTNNQVLGVLVTGNNRTGNAEGHTLTKVINNGKTVADSTLNTDTRTANGGKRYGYNLNYNLKTDSGRNSLNIDIDYSPFQSHSNLFLDNLSFLPNGNQTGTAFRIYTPSSQQIDIYSAKADFSFKLNKSWEISSGLKYSDIRSRSNFDFYNNRQGILEPVTANSNYFDYREHIGAVYTSLSGAAGALTFQGGLRAERTSTSGYSLTLNSLNERHYFKLFPTVFLQYDFNADNALNFNYAYRINRPEYSRLNPAKQYASPYNFIVGNPALQPSFAQNLELSYLYKKKYSITMYYNVTRDMFSHISQQDNVNKIYIDTQQNLGFSAATGLRLSLPVKPMPWWNMDISADAYHQQDKSDYLGGSYNYHNFFYNAVLNQSFTLDKTKGIRAELTGTYNGPEQQGVYSISRNWEVDAGIKTNLLNGHGTLQLSANDIFNTNYYNVKVDYLNQKNEFFHRNDSRNISLSFSYRLGKDIKASRSRITASEEEKKRAQ